MRAPQLEKHEDFEGVGAHELNPRFDWIPEEHGDGTAFDLPHTDIVMNPVNTPALARAQALLHPANQLSTTVPYRLDGSDTSHYQFTQGGGKMIIGPGIWWWMHKAAQSTGYRDSTWTQAFAEMKRMAVEVPGSYFWGSSTTDADKQAANWIDSVVEAIAYIVMMGDMEENGLTEDAVVHIYESIEDWKWKHFGIQAPCSHYTGLFVSNGVMWQSERIRMSKFGPRPIILAAYVSREKLATLLAQYGHGLSFDAQQFSSNGPVPDVVGRCDMDEVLHKQPFLVSLNGLQTPDPPNTKPSTKKDTDMYIIDADGRNPATIDAGYATGISGDDVAAFAADGIPCTRIDAATWDATVALSDGLKARDRALSALTNSGGTPGPTLTRASGSIDLNAQTIDLTLS